jgi:WD40 repeat protein
MDDDKKDVVKLGSSLSDISGLAISPDGTLVAVGCGSNIVFYVLKDSGFDKVHILGTGTRVSSNPILYQKVSFSTDSKRLCVASQVRRSSKDHLFVTIWKWSGRDMERDQTINPLSLTVVSISITSKVTDISRVMPMTRVSLQFTMLKERGRCHLDYSFLPQS